MQSKNPPKLELLAPAQNLKTAIGAIDFGADAVYIGAKSFGARKDASNSIEDIKTLIDYAHKFNVKIYITINTILDDKELYEAQKLIYELYENGADGIIIQDMGLLEIDLPPIELHASTQCNIRTKEKVKFFENIGIKRAILARELSVQKIKEISKNSNIELECFIHGALCVCYSGQCYMSASVGGRSANRGECAQACRKKYSLFLEDKPVIKDEYLLSLKDFCAENYISELVDSGVTSFKIEGRLKDETYVKNVVLYYRKILDKYEKTSKGKIVSDFEPDINKTFNRGYTSYFLSGSEDKNGIFNFKTPKSLGEFIGIVTKKGADWFEIKTNKTLSKQDGLCFFGQNGLFGCCINKIENDKIYPNKKLKIKVGTKVYRNRDLQFENRIKNSKTKRLIGVEVTLYKDKITVSDGEFKVFISFEESEPSKNEEKMRGNIEACFKKSGESIFQAEKVNFKTDFIPFIPVSKLNEMRRKLYSNLEEMRLKGYKRSTFEKTKYSVYKEKAQDYRLNIHNMKAQEFYKKCGVFSKEFSLEKSKNFKNKELMRTKHCLRRAFGLCLKENKENKKMFLADEFNKKYPLEFDCSKCEMAIIGV